MTTAPRSRSLVAEVRTDLQAVGLDREAALSGSWARLEPRMLLDEAVAALSPKLLRPVDGDQYAEILLHELHDVESAVRAAATRVASDLPDAPQPQGFVHSVLRVVRPSRTTSRADQLITEITGDAQRRREEQLRRRHRLLSACGGTIAQLITVLTQVRNDRSSYQVRAGEALQIADSLAAAWRTRLLASEDQLPPRALERLVTMLASEPPAAAYARGLQGVTQPHLANPGETLPVAIMTTARDSVRRTTDVHGSLPELMGRLAEHLGWSPEEGRLNLAKYLFAAASSDLVAADRGIRPLYQVVPAGKGAVLAAAANRHPLAVATSINHRDDHLGLLQIIGDLALSDLPRPESSSAAAAARIIRPGVTGEQPRPRKGGIAPLDPGEGGRVEAQDAAS